MTGGHLGLETFELIGIARLLAANLFASPLKGAIDFLGKMHACQAGNVENEGESGILSSGAAAREVQQGLVIWVDKADSQCQGPAEKRAKASSRRDQHATSNSMTLKYKVSNRLTSPWHRSERERGRGLRRRTRLRVQIEKLKAITGERKD